MSKDYAFMYVNILEEIILLDHYLSVKIYDKENIILAGNYMKCFMQKLKNVLQRTKGTGFKFPKFHALLHLFTFVTEFGIFASYDTGPLEALHKDWTKRTSKRTQRRHSNFIHQVIVVAANNLLIDSHIKRENKKKEASADVPKITGTQTLYNKTPTFQLSQETQESQETQQSGQSTQTWTTTKHGVVVFGNVMLRNKRFELYIANVKSHEYNCRITKSFCDRHKIHAKDDLSKYFPQQLLREAIINLFNTEIKQHTQLKYVEESIPLYTFCKIKDLVLHADPNQLVKLKSVTNVMALDQEYKNYNKYEPMHRWSFVYYVPFDQKLDCPNQHLMLGKIFFFTHLEHLVDSNDTIIVKYYNLNTESRMFAVLQPQSLTETKTSSQCKESSAKQNQDTQTLLCKHISMEIEKPVQKYSTTTPKLILLPVENIRHAAICIPNDCSGTRFIAYKPVDEWPKVFEAIIRQSK